jgi:oxygen-independent coproporphyrinogen-3 oxidase
MIPLALYIHWPFCKAKCPYCDFNSHVRAAVDEAAWERALLAELEYAATQVPADRMLVSIFFGGGTPSLMPPRTVQALIERARALFATASELEITLEANPTSAEAARFEGFREAGVNRLSLGIQSLRAADLAFLGRQHNVKEAQAALALAKAIFPRFSFDLIYARPGQTLADWQTELEEALTMAGEHLSLYQLTIEPETPFERVYKAGDFTLPDEETAAALYDHTLARCAEAGLVRYEVSNFAKPGQESRHNLAYWRGESYLGIGPGAHGRYRDREGNWIATATLKSPERWLQAVETKGHGVEMHRVVPPLERGEEVLLTALRLREGLDKEAFHEATGLSLNAVSDPSKRARFAFQGLLEENARLLHVTDAGLLVLDTLLGELLVS